jgi:hypothetical protein
LEEASWSTIVSASGLSLQPITTGYPGGPTHVNLDVQPFHFATTDAMNEQLDLLDTKMREQEEQIDPQKKPKDQKAER